MELSLTTFVLEIINFLVLVWLLKRLFFAPVKRVIEERKASIAKTLNDAHDMKTQADELRVQYDGRLRAWEDEKARAQEELDKSLGEEKAKRLAQIAESLAAEREKMRVQEEKKATEMRERLERDAMKQSLEFSSRLLGTVASPEVEKTIIQLTLQRLQGLRASVRTAPGTKIITGAVRTAYGLSSEQKERIRNAITAEIGTDLDFQFTTDPSLLAGIEVALGGTVVRANLRDELAYFSEARPL